MGTSETLFADRWEFTGRSARVYWANWLPEQPAFRRDADGVGINALLNYGYSVVRAAVARAIIVAGLMPSLGIKHANRSNAFALADDLVEPLRPLVDDRVRNVYRTGNVQLDRAALASGRFPAWARIFPWTSFLQSCFCSGFPAVS